MIELNQQMKLLLAAIAATLAVGAALYMGFSSFNDTPQYFDVHLQCSACGKQFDMTARQVAAVRGKVGDPTRKMTCPACAKDTGEEMMQCRCGKWYLPKRDGSVDAARCPHCNYDPNKD